MRWKSPPKASRPTGAFGARPELRGLVDRFELSNRHTLFAWVARAGLPGGGARRRPPVFAGRDDMCGLKFSTSPPRFHLAYGRLPAIVVPTNKTAIATIS